MESDNWFFQKESENKNNLYADTIELWNTWVTQDNA